MYSPYRTPIAKASPDIKIPEPRISKLVILLIKLLGRIYLTLFFGVAGIILRDAKILCEAFKRSLAGESRCIIAFRHPNGGEPQVLTWLFLFKLRSIAKRLGIRFARRPHALFVYSYDVVRWGGWPAKFVMPNMGAVPVHHSKIDSKGMARIYQAIVDGPYPLALAPEGQVSYTIDSVPRLESGIARIGFHAAGRLEEKNCPVEILPVSIHFRYGPWGKMNMALLLRIIEKHCGFSRREAGKSPLTERLRRCRDHILEINERRYSISADPSLSFEERIERVTNAALETAERMLGIKAEGDFFFRLHKARQICWDHIFLPGADSLDGMTHVERSMFDLKAGEAWHITRHLELADFSWHFRCPLPTEETALHNRIEYVQNLWDFANRSRGGNFSSRLNIFPRKVIIRAAPVIDISKRLPLYHEDKKAAVAEIMSELTQAYLDCINETNKTERG